MSAVAVRSSVASCCILEGLSRERMDFCLQSAAEGSGVRYLPPLPPHPRLLPRPTFTCFERSPASIHSSPTMFGSIPNYFYEQRNGLLRATSYAGVAYLVSSYVKEQLQDVKDEVLVKRKAREK